MGDGASKSDAEDVQARAREICPNYRVVDTRTKRGGGATAAITTNQTTSQTITTPTGHLTTTTTQPVTTYVPTIENNRIFMDIECQAP